MKNNKLTPTQVKLKNVLRPIVEGILNEAPDMSSVWKYKDEDGKPSAFPPGFQKAQSKAASELYVQVSKLITAKAQVLDREFKQKYGIGTTQGILEKLIALLEDAV